jgi:hypothetical protein
MTGIDDTPTVADDAIRSMLESRADRAGPARFDASALAAEAIGRSHGAQVWRGLPLPRLLVAASSLAAVAVLLAVLALPLGTAPSSGPPTQGPSGSTGTQPPPPSVPAPHVLSPDELGSLVRTRAPSLDGALVAVRGRLERDRSIPCPTGIVCANTRLADSGDAFRLRPVGNIGPGPWDGSGPKDGLFLVRITAAIDHGLPVVDFVGDLTPPTDGSLAWSVADIHGGAARKEGGYAAVDGWLVRTPLHPCASNPHPPAGPAYGCPDEDYLTDASFQPLQPDGSSIGPPSALDLPSGSYEQWAPNPAHFGRDSVGVEPREAIYVLQLVGTGCGPNADCYQGPENLRWRIAGRLDPIPPVDASPDSRLRPSPSGTLMSGANPDLISPPSGTAWTVADLATPRWTGGPHEFVVRAYLVATPPLRCHVYISPGPYGCGEYDWLTDEPFQPWTSDGETGSVREPGVGLRVQNGAYGTFAQEPARGRFKTLQPHLGTYVVRFSVHSTCEYGSPSPSPSPDPVCLGGSVFVWEVVGRVS